MEMRRMRRRQPGVLVFRVNRERRQVWISRGGGPASRESSLLDPFTASDEIHAVLLSGGSAFGLDAAGGVQKYLEERGIGF